MQNANDIVIDDYDTVIDDTPASAKERVSAFVSDSKDQVVKGAEHVARVAKENPKTAIAAGAAVVVGAIAAAAIPVIRAATKSKPAARKTAAAPRKSATAKKTTTARKPSTRTTAVSKAS